MSIPTLAPLNAARTFLDLDIHVKSHLPFLHNFFIMPMCAPDLFALLLLCVPPLLISVRLLKFITLYD